MATSRGVLCAILVTVLVLSVAAVCCAQDEPESIYVANTKVITIREKGSHPSTRARAVAIEKAITDVIASQDTENPDVTLKEVDGLWTIFVGDTRIVAVHPAEASANDLPARSLGAMWVKNLQETLPKSAPAAAPTGEGPAEEPVVRDEPASTGSPGMPAVPAVAAPLVPTKAPIGAPTLLVRDYYNTVRALPEEEYVERRDELVTHLIQDLTPFITGKVPVAAMATPGSPAAATPTAPEPAGPEPPGATETTASAVSPTAAGPPVAPVTTGSGATSTPPKVDIGTPAATSLPDVKEGDPAYAKVPQKNRIRKKLEAARQPYMGLRTEDEEAAKPVGKLLAACRDAFARGDFDESELYADSALRLLGVEFQ